MTIRQHTLDTPYMVGPVHCYSTEIDGAVILFDTGPPTSRAQKYLQKNIDLKRLRYVFLTHCHIDHCGLAAWLEENTDAQIFLPYRDGLKILSQDQRVQDMYNLLEDLGFGGDYLRELHTTLTDGKIFPPYPKRFKIVEDDMPKKLGLGFQACPGHSQSDVVYFNDEWAVSGDTLLKGIFQSPLLDVDLETGERFDNYGSYCVSLLKLGELRRKHVCPGHRTNIESVDATILYYIGKMLSRIVRMGKILELKDVAAMVGHMFQGDTTEPFLMYLKASEIMFMQDFLRRPETLKNSLVSLGLFDMVAEVYTLAVSGQGGSRDD